MNKNAYSRMMINQYYEEQAIIAEENAEMAIDTPMMDLSKPDPLWDCWYDVAFLYEPECTKDAVQMTKQQNEQIESNDFDVDDLFYDEPDYEPNSKDERRMRVSKRRKNAALHKRKTRRNVQALKAGAVPEKLHDEITKHLEGLHEMMSSVMGDRNCYERQCREIEAKVKQELEEKMAA